jgi:hypothetical protein
MIETPHTQVHDRDPIHASSWSRPHTHKYMFETPYTQVLDRDPIHTRTWSCTCVCVVSIMYLCVWSLDHELVCMGSRLCTCVFGVSIMYLCVWGLDHELVCMGSRETPYTQVHDRDPTHTSTWSRPHTRKFMIETPVSIMCLCVWGLDHVLVCMGSRSCTCVYGVSIMYLCVLGLDHVLVCMGSRSCTCVHGVSIMYLCVWGLDHELVCIDPIHTSSWTRPHTHKYMIETPHTQVHDRVWSLYHELVCMGFEIQFMVCNRQAQKCSGVKLVKCSFRKMSHVTELRLCSSLCFYIDHY